MTYDKVIEVSTVLPSHLILYKYFFIYMKTCLCC